MFQVLFVRGMERTALQKYVIVCLGRCAFAVMTGDGSRGEDISESKNICRATERHHATPSMLRLAFLELGEGLRFMGTSLSSVEGTRSKALKPEMNYDK